jgi:hypothetical protein
MLCCDMAFIRVRLTCLVMPPRTAFRTSSRLLVLVQARSFMFERALGLVTLLKHMVSLMLCAS